MSSEPTNYQSVILTLDMLDKDPTTDTSKRDAYEVREAVRAVVFDEQGSVPLLHARARDYYKLPGGGIDAGEDLPTALARELLEEIGSQADVIADLGQVIEWKDFRKMKQISYCYTARLRGDKGQPDFTDSEIAEGFEIVWTSGLDEAIELVSATADSTDISISFMTTRDTAFLKRALAITS